MGAAVIGQATENVKARERVFAQEPRATAKCATVKSATVKCATVKCATVR
jgi:hypothetical protein